MMDIECWMVDSFRISQPVRSVRFQEIMGCLNFGFWMLNVEWWVGEIRKAEWEIGLRPMLE